MKTYIEIKRLLFDLLKSSDHEAAHIQADCLLQDALRSASIGVINKRAADEIIDIYQQIHKWYA